MKIIPSDSGREAYKFLMDDFVHLESFVDFFLFLRPNKTQLLRNCLEKTMDFFVFVFLFEIVLIQTRSNGVKRDKSRQMGSYGVKGIKRGETFFRV